MRTNANLTDQMSDKSRGYSRLDLAGQVFGDLTALEDVGREKHGSRLWRCRCSCGAEKIVSVNRLRSGATQSCGCRVLKVIAERHTTHGHARAGGKTPEYRIWLGIRRRCTNKKSAQFRYYGGRGITFAAAWEEFAVFLRDVGPQPSPEHSLDRIDPAGHYEPGNVRWSTAKEQQNNRRDNVRLRVGSRRITIAELANALGLPYRATYRKLIALWPDLAIDEPAHFDAPVAASVASFRRAAHARLSGRAA